MYLTGLQFRGRFRGVQGHRREGARPVIIIMGVKNKGCLRLCLMRMYGVVRILGTGLKSGLRCTRICLAEKPFNARVNADNDDECVVVGMAVSYSFTPRDYLGN